MKKLIPLVLLLAGCGSDVEGACQDYIDAWLACIDEAYADDTTGMADTYIAATEGTCDAYAGFTDVESYDLLTCYADTIDAGDCSTPEGYATAVDLSGCL